MVLWRSLSEDNSIVICFCGFLQGGVHPFPWIQGTHHSLHTQDPAPGPLATLPLNHRGMLLGRNYGSRGTPPSKRLLPWPPASRCPFLLSWEPPPIRAHVLSWLPAEASPFSVPIPLSISISITFEFSPFHLSNQHRTCLSPPLSTSLPVCRLQPGAHRSPLSGNYDSLPSSRRKSLFFSLNVQVNFYRLFIQPLYWQARYLLRKRSP